jgi:hypothetical protein
MDAEDFAIGAEITRPECKDMNTMNTEINADALPYAGWARFVTFLYNGLMDMHRIGLFFDRAHAAAQVSRDLYTLSDIVLASHGLTRPEVPNYLARKLGITAEAAPANNNAKVA